MESSVITGGKGTPASEKNARNLSEEEPGEGGTGAATRAASLPLPRNAESAEETRDRTKNPPFDFLLSAWRQGTRSLPELTRIKRLSTEPAASARSRHGFDPAAVVATASVGWRPVAGGREGNGGAFGRETKGWRALNAALLCADLRESGEREGKGGGEVVWFGWRGRGCFALGAHVNLPRHCRPSPVSTVTDDCGSSSRGRLAAGCQCGAQ